MLKTRLCEVEGCSKPHTAKGMCHRHYYRAYRGLPLEPVVLSLPDWICETDLAYAAGFIDADGSILIERSINRGVVRHVPRVCAFGIDVGPLEFLKSIFGGSISETHRSGSNFPFFQWGVTNFRAIDTARYVMPYLKIKNIQAYILSCFEYEAVWKKGGVDVKISQEEFSRREDLVEEIRSLNQRDYLTRLKGCEQ